MTLRSEPTDHPPASPPKLAPEIGARPCSNRFDATLPAVPAEIPEHIVVLLLEGAQQLLSKGEADIQRQDEVSRDHHLARVLCVLDELKQRVNGEQGGELASNLLLLYEWWDQRVVEACAKDDADILRVVSSQMGDIRRSWEHVLFQGVGLSENPDF